MHWHSQAWDIDDNTQLGDSHHAYLIFLIYHGYMHAFVQSLNVNFYIDLELPFCYAYWSDPYNWGPVRGHLKEYKEAAENKENV